MTDYGPSITLARLYERTSRNGKTYLAGRLGLASIVILKTEEVSEHGQPIWVVKVQEPPARRDSQDGAQRSPELQSERRSEQPADEAKRDWQRPSNSLNDEIPF
jgi:hypothetical protein